MKIRPRYLPPISKDNTVLDLVTPATEEDFESAARWHLPTLAEVPWRLGPAEQAVLATYFRRYEELGADPKAVKVDLLRVALEIVQVSMTQKQTVRFERSWLKGRDGRKRMVVPASYLGWTGAPPTDVIDLTRCPTAEKVDWFTRWLEQQLIGVSARFLGERQDLLDDRASKLEFVGFTELADPCSSTFEPDYVRWLQGEYSTSIAALLSALDDPSHRSAVIDVLEAVHSGASAWSRTNALRRDRLAIQLRSVRRLVPECVSLVHRAWHAADELAIAGAPLPHALVM